MDICGLKGCKVTVCQASVPLWKGLVYVVKILSAKERDSVLKMGFTLSNVLIFSVSLLKGRFVLISIYIYKTMLRIEKK